MNTHRTEQPIENRTNFTTWLTNKTEQNDQSRIGQFRKAVILGLAGATGCFCLGEAMRPQTLEETSVTVKDGQNPGKEVCGAVAELAKEHDRELNTEQCLADLKDVTLPDGTTVELVATNRIIGVAGDSVAFNAMDIKTSIDEKIEQAREKQ